MHIQGGNFMQIINKSEFEAMKNDGLLLVDFFATWCGPCKMLAPVLESLSTTFEGKINIVKVDVDKDQDLAMQFGIMSVPTMILFKDGAPVKQIQGFQSAPQLEAFLNQYM